jgi:hypothetical protein
VNGRLDVFGLTLAELALVVLFAFLVAAQRNDPAEAKKGGRVQALEAQVASLRTENDELKRKLAQFSTPRPGLRSRQTPSCYETGYNTSWLFTALILRPNTYSVNNVEMDHSKLMMRFRGAVEAARIAGCVHRVQVVAARDLNITDYEAALRQLEQDFYVSRRVRAE